MAHRRVDALEDVRIPRNKDSDESTETGARESPRTSRWISFSCTVCSEPSRAVPTTDRAARLLCRQCFGKGVDRRPRELNELTGKEWAARSRSVEQYPDTRSQKQRVHGASFPQSLAREQIEIFTRRGQTVLDPFVGVGTTLDACVETGRKGIGVDINPEFVDLALSDLRASQVPESSY